MVQQRKLEWYFGHVSRMGLERYPHNLLHGQMHPVLDQLADLERSVLTTSTRIVLTGNNNHGVSTVEENRSRWRHMHLNHVLPALVFVAMHSVNYRKVALTSDT